MTLYVVGRIASEVEFQKWDIIGIFDSEAKAVAVCRTPNHFIGPLTLNVDFGDETAQEWPNGRYPGREKT